MSKLQISFTIEDVSTSELDSVRTAIQDFIDNSAKEITLGSVVWTE